MPVQTTCLAESFKLVHGLTAPQKADLLGLYHDAWWGKEHVIEDIEQKMKGSFLVFGLIEEETDRLIGFARVITDHFKYVYVYDLMVDPRYREQGLATIIMNAMLTHPDLKHCRNFELTCRRDMRAFYEKFNFSEDFGNDVVAMRRINPAGKN